MLLSAVAGLVFMFSLFKMESFFSCENVLLSWGFPVGFSYFMVRHIHTLFESYKENLTDFTLTEYLCYAGFFPAYFAGPIHRLPEFLHDLRNKTITRADISGGLERVLYGYVKIIFLANYLVNEVMHLRIQPFQDSNPALFQYLDCVEYGANLYLLFAGYSDIAIGVSLIAGFRLPENFNFPFLAKNISDFWKRWHMSLSDWCKDYVFKPVFAQSRIFPLSIILTMLAIGLWHEFTGRYVIWAVYHGMGIAVWQYFDKKKSFRLTNDSTLIRPVLTALSTIFTLHFVILSFCITKEDSVEHGWIAFTTLFSFIL